MLRSLTIRLRLALLAGLAVCFVIVSGVVGLYSSHLLSERLALSGVSLAAIRNQGTADMMHDAIRGDVLAMYQSVTSGGTAADFAAISKDFAEHGKEFTDRIAANEALALDPSERSALEAIKPDIGRYLQQAAQTLQQFQNGKHDAAVFAEFNASFTRLEDSMGKFSDLLEQRAEADRAATRSTEVFTQTVLHVALWGGSALILLLSWLLGRSIANPLHVLSQFMQTLGTDLSRRLPEDGRDEITVIARASNSMLQDLSRLVEAVRDSARALEQTANGLAGDTQNLRERAGNSSNLVMQTASQAEQIASAAADVLAHTQRSDQAIQQAARLADHSASRMDGVVSSNARLSDNTSLAAEQIEKLAENAREIDTVTGVIREIAEQTNLLALNAAIEAARAGESGRGFAVVADEVRKLAERTAASTSSITQMTDGIRQATQSAVTSIQTVRMQVADSAAELGAAREAQQDILARARELQVQSQEVAGSSAEQGHAVQQVASAMSQVSTAIATNLAAFERLQQMASQLQSLSSGLNERIGRYRT